MWLSATGTVFADVSEGDVNAFYSGSPCDFGLTEATVNLVPCRWMRESPSSGSRSSPDQKLRISLAGPMTTVGVSAGLIQRRSRSSSGSGMLTHPVVGLPVSAWMKIADPASGMTGSVLYSTTAKLG